MRLLSGVAVTGLNASADVVSAAGELAAELRDQGGGALVVGAIEGVARHGGNDQGHRRHRHQHGQRKQHQQAPPEAHGFSPESHTLPSCQVPSEEMLKS